MSCALFEIQKTNQQIELPGGHFHEFPGLGRDQRVPLTWSNRAGPTGHGAFLIGYPDLMKDTVLCFARDDKVQDLDPALCLTNRHESRLDVSRIRAWLSTCTNAHYRVCNSDLDISPVPATVLRPGFTLIRLIDATANCLIEVNPHDAPKYVALSYVWGGVTNFRLTTANKAELMKPGCLKRIWWRLPRTIQDAISLTRELAVPFLWVDSLCLLQNDEEDIQSGIDSMDLIYERAHLTVAAACGHDANSGLPGVQDNSRGIPKHAEEVAPGVHLDVFTPLDPLLKISSYRKRAWTFQEEMLSRRVLYFVENKAYFRCHEATIYENILGEKEASPTLGDSLVYATQMHYPLTDYRTILSHYSKRFLTNQNDAFRAMAGIVRRFSFRMRCDFFEGFPEATIDYFIVFRHQGPASRRRRPFPSYSWTGWIGEIYFLPISHINEWLSFRTWIKWHSVSLIDGAISMRPVYREDEANSKAQNEAAEHPYDLRHPFKPPVWLPFATQHTTPTDRDLSTYFHSSRSSMLYLNFWTLAAFYTIQDTDVFEGTGSLCDNAGKVCGGVYMDGFEETRFFESQGSFEFILLSESQFDISALLLDKVPYPRVDDPYQYYNVMLLEWDDTSTMAERCGIGVIFKAAIERSLKPGPVWKEILLA